MAFKYCNVEFEDENLAPEEFGQRKAAGKYPNGQLPVLHLDDGTMMSQSNSIARYICAAYKGRNGEVLYPGNTDPMLSYKIDDFVEDAEELTYKCAKWHIVPILPQYKEKDDHFVTFITTKFPTFLQKIEDRLTKSQTKYMFTNTMTLADICFAAFLIQFPYNDAYDYQHIVQAVFLDYPKTKALAEQLKGDFGFYMKDMVKSAY